MKLLRTIRFDGSDDQVYERAAGPDEWAVSGAFAFADLDAAALTGKRRQAFANGFLSLDSFGRSTFVTVAEIGTVDLEGLVDRLARHFIAHYGAPDREAALPAARDEIGFAQELCQEAPINTVLAVSRRLDEDGGIREAVRSVAPPGEAAHARIWDVVEE